MKVTQIGEPSGKLCAASLQLETDLSLSLPSCNILSSFPEGGV
jgi:hypothetical protein